MENPFNSFWYLVKWSNLYKLPANPSTNHVIDKYPFDEIDYSYILYKVRNDNIYLRNSGSYLLNYVNIN